MKTKNDSYNKINEILAGSWSR